MRKLGLAYNDLFTAHDAGPGHPERAERVKAIMDAIKEAPWFDVVEIVEAREATEDEIALIHNPRYIKAMRRLCNAGGEFLPAMEAAVGPESFPAALRAAGAGLTLADGIMEGRWKTGFAPTRPPGHHSQFERPRGFCIFNNIAILARYLIEKYDLSRVVIFDFDVHHGNGTEAAFWKDPKVLFCSIHQEGLFPSDTGNWHDIGEEEGEGYTINIPLPANSDDDEYLKAIDRYATARILEFKPEFYLVSAGFDGHRRDILSGMKLTHKGYAGIAERMKKLADVNADGKIITLLEGGYDLEGVAEGATSYLTQLIKED